MGPNDFNGNNLCRGSLSLSLSHPKVLPQRLQLVAHVLRITVETHLFRSKRWADITAQSLSNIWGKTEVRAECVTPGCSDALSAHLNGQINVPGKCPTFYFGNFYKVFLQLAVCLFPVWNSCVNSCSTMTIKVLSSSTPNFTEWRITSTSSVTHSLHTKLTTFGGAFKNSKRFLQT